MFIENTMHLVRIYDIGVKIPVGIIYRAKDLKEFDDPALASIVKETGANLVARVVDSEQGAPLFLMERACKNNLAEELELFTFKVNNINRNAIVTILGNIALYEPDKCAKLLKNAELTLDGYIYRGGMSAKEKEDLLQEMKSRFIANKAILANPDASKEELSVAKREFDMVCASFTQASLAEFMAQVLITGDIPTDEELEEKYLYLDKAASASKVKLEIRPRYSTEKIKNSNGKYRLTIHYVDNTHNGKRLRKLLKFPGKVETAIYYTLLMVRKYNNIEKIEILDCEKEFIGIYRALYIETYDVAKRVFDKIRNRDEGDKPKSQGRYRNYIPNIRKAVDKALARIDNPAIYHYEYHYQKGGRFYVKSDHISLSANFLKDATRLQNPKERATYM